MANTFRLTVVAPDRTVFDEDAMSWIAPSAAGYMGVWPGHEPTLIALNPGVIEVTDANDQIQHVAVGGGFAEIRPDGVVVLAHEAKLASEIDVAEEERKMEQARKALRGEASEFSQSEARHELDRAMSRIRATKMK